MAITCVKSEIAKYTAYDFCKLHKTNPFFEYTDYETVENTYLTLFDSIEIILNF